MNEDLNKAIVFVQFSATNEDLNQIIEAVKYRRAQLARRNTATLRVGATVSFVGRNGATVQGTVQKVMIKNVSVKTPTTTWRVPANMLTVVG